MLVPLTSAVEALLFAAGGEGLSLEELAGILELPPADVRSLCLALQQEYEERGSGLQVVELAGKWQLVTRSEYAGYLRRMAAPSTSNTLSTAALEVLAIVAYKQPISRADIEAIRGVQSERAIATLVHRRLIAEVGRQDSPGRPILYGTTDVFLQTFGLRSLEDLPPLPAEPPMPSDLSLFHLTPTLPRD